LILNLVRNLQSRSRRHASAAHRFVVVTLLGFASGLPLALCGAAMQAWLAMEGVDLATLGLLSLVGLPYTFKFLWAPLMDRFDPPWLGRRRGWLVLTQLALALMLLAMAAVSPTQSTRGFALLAVALAFLSASQDVVIDAYRTDLLPPRERGLGSSLAVMGYRLAMIVSGGVALIWTDAGQGGGWTWPQVYRLMAALMTGAAVLSAIALPRLPDPVRAGENGGAGNDVPGFLAVIAAVAIGVIATDRFGADIARVLLSPWLAGGAIAPASQARWINLVALLLGVAVTLPLAAWVARMMRFETLLAGLHNYFAQAGAGVMLALIVLYKLGDAFSLSLLTPFLLRGMAFGPAEVGLVNKIIGLWLTIFGALAGGALMLRLGLYRSLLLFGVMQGAANLGFWWLAVSGRGALPSLLVPAFDWGFVHLALATPVDGGLLLAVAVENISGGMGTAAFVALLMSLCNARYTATQYALLSAFASVGRVWVGPLAGVLAEAIGWPGFFVVATALSLPALVILIAMRSTIRALEGDGAVLAGLKA
jgi:PAT family beta-lactamase induction signal transducer AmpG